jgi:hypothetical protein
MMGELPAVTTPERTEDQTSEPVGDDQGVLDTFAQPDTEGADDAETEGLPSPGPLMPPPEPGNRRGRGPGGESPLHKRLKEQISQHPTILDEGLRFVDIEHPFLSGDQLDLLMEDSRGVPVVVEVETGPLRTGLWQAIKYKHLLAAERDLPCDQVRAMLVTPFLIPEAIKKECDQHDVEPKEIAYK